MPGLRIVLKDGKIQEHPNMPEEHVAAAQTLWDSGSGDILIIESQLNDEDARRTITSRAKIASFEVLP